MSVTLPDISEIQNIQSIKPQEKVVNTVFLNATGVDRVETGNVNPLSKPVKMLMAMLKTSLCDNEIDMDVFKGANYHDWSKLLEIANTSAVTGMLSDAANKLPKSIIPTDVALEMAEATLEAEESHAYQEKILGELSQKLESKGVEMVQLKGIGFSMNYPVPQHRFGGDIDIFTRKKGTITDGYSNTWDMFNKMMIEEGCTIKDHKCRNNKHSKIDYKGLCIENHNYFLCQERITEAGKMDEYLHKTLNPREQILPNGTKILVPSKEFNTVFMVQHAFQHIIFGGINIHHLTDWAMHIKKKRIGFS